MKIHKRSTLSLYLHIPFCTKKCPYCHFFVVKDNPDIKKRFLELLYLEWQQKKELAENKEIVSLYFGGGTPSLLEPEELAYLLSFLPKGKEVTIEINPESVTKEKLKNYKDLGINRLSIGVQTFDNTLLKTLQRTHTAEEAVDTIFETADMGFDNISIDLMYDLPNQSLASFVQTVEKAITLPISHISLYNLVIEPNSAYFKKKKEIEKRQPKQEISFSMLEVALGAFERGGFQRYEISAFSKNQISLHNTGYWTGRPFLGLGPSAFSYWERSRFSNVANLMQYEKKLKLGESPVDFREQLSDTAHQRELFCVRLRYLKPFMPFGVTKEELYHWQKEGYIGETKEGIFLTQKGCLFYDTIASDFIE